MRRGEAWKRCSLGVGAGAGGGGGRQNRGQSQCRWLGASVALTSCSCVCLLKFSRLWPVVLMCSLQICHASSVSQGRIGSSPAMPGLSLFAAVWSNPSLDCGKLCLLRLCLC